MKIYLWGIQCAAAQYFFLFPLFLGIWFLALKRLQRAKKVAAALVGQRVELLRNFSYIKQCVRAVLLIIASSMLWIALLRPQWNELEETVMHQGRDVLVALDISRSMLATDIGMHRISAAKEKIRSLIRSLGSDRVGLILFSGTAMIHCPFTADYAAFDSFLDLVHVELFSTGTTVIDGAIQKALQVFDRVPNRKTKLCVLFTDGEDFSTNLESLKVQAQQEAMHIVAVGVGTPQGSPIPQVDIDGVQRGHLIDDQGNVVITRLNESVLSVLAADVGGTYVRMTDNDADIQTIVSYIESFEKEDIQDKMVRQLDDQYPWFALISFICLVVEWLL